MDGINQETNQMSMWLEMTTADWDFESCYLVVDVDPNMAYMPAEEVRVMPSPYGDDECPTYMGTSFKYSNPDMVETGYLEIDGVTYFMNPWENLEKVMGDYYGEEYYGEEDDWTEDDWKEKEDDWKEWEDEWEEDDWKDDEWEEDWEEDWEEGPEYFELYLTQEGSDLS